MLLGLACTVNPSLHVVMLMAGDSERETPCGTKEVRPIDKLQEGDKTLKETVSEN